MRRRLSHGYTRLTHAVWTGKERLWVEGLFDLLGPRKSRLLLSAWCRDLTERWLDKALRRDKKLRENVKGVYLAALEVSDQFADTGKSTAALRAARKSVFFRAIAETTSVSSFFDTLLSEDSLLGTMDRCAMVATTRDGVASKDLIPLLRRYLSDLTLPKGSAGRIEPECLDTKVLDLAQTIYQQRKFEQMPRLAKALELAGCQNSVVLAHCRDAGAVHIRGCWILDLVLGKAS